MHTTCLNCGHHFKGNFCTICGQKSSVKRLTVSVLFADALHFLTHLENGFLYTAWSFLVKPGISSMNYIAGKRKEYQKPVSYFLIWTGFYILLHNSIINYFHFQLTTEVITQMNIREQSNIYFRQHFTFFIIPVILLSSLILYFILARPRYNFIEVLTLSFFGSGTYFMMSFISDAFIGLILRMNTLTTNVFLWQLLLSSVYNFWFTYDFFKRLHMRFFWLRLIGVSILIALGGWVIMFYLPVAWIYFIT